MHFSLPPQQADMPTPPSIHRYLIVSAVVHYCLDLRIITLTGILASGLSAIVQAAQPSMDTLKTLSLEELLAIEVISVSRYPTRLSDTASAIQVITQDQIRRSGAVNVPEALRLANNLNVAQKNAHDWGISARGFNTELSNKLLVLIDGRTVYTPLFSGVFWDTQDYLLEDLAHIEVISGPGGALWGANAVNGVINITTKTARETQGVYVHAGAGAQPRVLTAARYGGALSRNTHFRVYGKFTEWADERLPTGTDAGDDWRRSQGGFRLDAEPTADAIFTLQGDAYSGTNGGVNNGDASTSGGNLLGRWQHTFTDGSDLRLQVYYAHTHLRMQVPAEPNGLAPAGSLTDDLDTYDFDFQHRWRPLDRHQIVWGFGYRYTDNHVSNAPALAFLPEKRSSSLTNFFVQDDFNISPTVVLTAGAKLEHNDYTGHEFQPNLRLRWRVAADQLLWAAVSRAVRTPSRVDRDLQQPPGPIVVLQGSPDFRSEQVIAYEAGYRAQIGTHASVSIAAFFNDYAHLRSVDITPETILPLYFANDLEGETYGLELATLVGLTDYWRLHFGYTWLKQSIRVLPGRFDLNNALNETADPEHQLAIRSALDLPHGIEFDAALRWVDSFTINNGGAPATVPSYAELDLRVGWHINDQLELSLNGRNLLHDHHLEHGAPNPNQVEIRRSAYLKLTWRY